LTRDGRRLLSESSVEAMTRDHLTAAQRAGGEPILSPGQGWGYGVGVVRERTEEGIPAGAYGWTAGSARAGSPIPSTTVPSSSSRSAPSPARGISPRIARSGARRTAICYNSLQAGAHIRWVATAAGTVTVGHAAFDAAVASWPNEPFTGLQVPCSSGNTTQRLENRVRSLK
jgi:hypothetical protein